MSGRTLHSPLEALSDGLQAAGGIWGKVLKPLAPAPQRGFLNAGRRRLICDSILNDLCLVAAVGNQKVWQFVVDLVTIPAAQSADDEFYLVAGALNPGPFPTPDDAKLTLATRARDILRTLDKKHRWYGFQQA